MTQYDAVVGLDPRSYCTVVGPAGLVLGVGWSADG